MNRRTFIKLTGITTIAITIPLMANPEPQWIKMTDQMPPVNKRIIVGTNFEYTTSRNMQKYKTGETFYLGQRIAEENLSPYKLQQYTKWCFESTEDRIIIMEVEARFHEFYKTNVTSIFYDPDKTTSNVICQIRQLKSMENSKIYKQKEHYKYSLRLICNKYWLLVDKKMPTYLPPIPTNAITKHKFVEKRKNNNKNTVAI